MTSAYRQAASAYGAGAALASEPRQVMWLLHDGVLRDLSAAKIAYEQNQLHQCCRHVAHANRIIAGLLTHLHFEAAGAAGGVLRNAYFSVSRALARVMFDANVTDTLQSCVTMFQMLRDARGDLEIHESTVTPVQSG